MKRVLVICFGCLFLLSGCRQNGEILPTAVLQPIESLLPTHTPTIVLPTATAVATTVAEDEDVLFATIPSVTPRVSANSTDTQLKITAPSAGADVPVGQLTTIAGSAMPIPKEPILLRVLALGGEELVRETAVVDANGDWSVTTTIPPQIMGSAQVMAQVESQPDAVAVQINLRPSGEDDVSSITMIRPTNGGKVVAGYAVLFDGEVVQPLDESVTMAVQSADCTESWTSNSIVVPNGRWQGWSVLPPTVAAGAGCAIAFTGERGTENAREVRMPITILDVLDEQALLLQLGNVGTPLLTAGEATYFYGIAVHAPNNQIEVNLVTDDLETSNTLIAQGTAVVNSFGYWEINLDIPLETHSQQALFIVTMGEGDTYREVREVVFIQNGADGNQAVDE